MPARRAAADRPGRAGRDPPGGGEPYGAHPQRGPHRARLLGVAGRSGARPRRPPCRHAARLQGGRRGAVRPRPGQGRLRHRDAGAGHQHAGPVRGAGAAGEVQRRGARRPHAGGVHPADRAGRPAGHRRRGPRGRGVVARGRPAARGRAGVDPHVSAAVELPAVVQHGGQPGRLGRHRRGARAAGVVVRAVPGGPVGRRRGPPGAAQRGDHGVARPRDGVRPRRLRRVLRDPAAHRRAGEGAGPAQRGRAPLGRRGLAGAAQGRRRDPGADRPAGRAGRRARPGVGRLRRAEAAGAHRGPVGGPDRGGRVRRGGGGAGPGTGAEALQPPLAAGAARPGRRRAPGRR